MALVSREPGNRAARIRRLGVTGVAGELLLIGMLSLLTLRVTEVDFFNDYVSQYANTDYRELFRGTLLVHGIGMLAIAAGLWLALPASAAARCAVVLLGVAALGVMTGAVFSMDPPGAARSTTGLVHKLSALVSFPVEVVALAVFPGVFGRSPGWRTTATVTTLFAVAGALSLLWFGIGINFGAYPGLPERVALGLFAVWELFIAVRLATHRASAAR